MGFKFVAVSSGSLNTSGEMGVVVAVPQMSSAGHKILLSFFILSSTLLRGVEVRKSLTK